MYLFERAGTLDSRSLGLSSTDIDLDEVTVSSVCVGVDSELDCGDDVTVGAWAAAPAPAVAGS